jgi:hypothetical protein
MVYTQVIESRLDPDEPPPSPQFWGDRVISKSPRIGGFRGRKGGNEVEFDLCVHRKFKE